MKTFFRLLVLCLILGGWALAAAALHVVRTEGQIPVIGKVLFVPKEHMSFKDIYVDTRAWTDADREAHPLVTARLRELHWDSALGPESQPATKPVKQTAIDPAIAKRAPVEQPRREPSIFDEMGEK